MKPFLTFRQQLDLLIARGLYVEDHYSALSFLSRENYYRLSAYFIPFYAEPNKFKPGATFDDIARLYEFDRELRVYILCAISAIEIYFKTQIAYHCAYKCGPAVYLNDKPFADLINEKINASDEDFVKHHQLIAQPLPIWAAVELLTFGEIIWLFKRTNLKITKQICNEFGKSFKQITSFLHRVRKLRNICAHQGRVFNRVIINNKNKALNFNAQQVAKEIDQALLHIGSSAIISNSLQDLKVFYKKQNLRSILQPWFE